MLAAARGSPAAARPPARSAGPAVRAGGGGGAPRRAPCAPGGRSRRLSSPQRTGPARPPVSRCRGAPLVPGRAGGDGPGTAGPLGPGDGGGRASAPARLKPSSGAGGRAAPEEAAASRRVLGAVGAAGGRPGLGAAALAALLAAPCSEPAASRAASPGARTDRCRAGDFSVAIVHANLAPADDLNISKVQPGGQKCAGLAGEEASASALGDLALPRLGRAGGVVVIASDCV